MSKTKINLIFMLIIVFLVLSVVKIPGSSRESLHAALNATGAKFDEVTINGWTLLNGDLDKDGLITICNSVFLELNFDPKVLSKIEESHNSGVKLVREEMSSQQIHIVVIAQVIYPQGSKSPETYVVINVDAISDAARENWQAKLAEILMKMGGKAHITTCLVGWLDGKLEQEDQQTKLLEAMQAIDVHLVDYTSDGKYVSITGFTDEIEDTFDIGYKKMNLNLVMRYNPLENRTLVMVGTPIIPREY